MEAGCGWVTAAGSDPLGQRVPLSVARFCAVRVAEHPTRPTARRGRRRAGRPTQRTLAAMLGLGRPSLHTIRKEPEYRGRIAIRDADVEIRDNAALSGRAGRAGGRSVQPRWSITSASAWSRIRSPANREGGQGDDGDGNRASARGGRHRRTSEPA
ncbi:MAG: hypothetical protein LC749_11215 [Actinobacteria bacterium]|nr:hypothetical protein [Actinomycetota bacterium]